MSKDYYYISFNRWYPFWWTDYVIRYSIDQNRRLCVFSRRNDNKGVCDKIRTHVMFHLIFFKIIVTMNNLYTDTWILSRQLEDSHMELTIQNDDLLIDPFMIQWRYINSWQGFPGDSHSLWHVFNVFGDCNQPWTSYLLEPVILNSLICY